MELILKNTWKVFIAILFLAGVVWASGTIRSASAAEQTLSSCYKAKGLVWGNVQERAGTAKSFGILNYVGSIEQNKELASDICGLDNEPKLGAGYAPVTGYSTTLTSRVSASATTIPVASVRDKSGNTIVPGNITASSTVRMYFNFEAGTTREEPFVCTGISGLNLTGCVRGVAFQGSNISSSSTIAQIHNAGASIIMTNLGVFYANEFVSISGDQVVFDQKTFNTIPKVTSTNALSSSYDQLVTKYYVDSISGSQFAATNVSTTQGLVAYTGLSNCSTSGTCVGVNASTTASINGGFLNFAAITGKLYWDIVNFLAGSWTWAGTNTFAGVNGTSTAMRLNFTASNVLDGVNKQYADNGFATNSATGTAAVAITAGQPIYATASSTLAIANSSNATATFQFVGVAETSVSAGQEVRYTKPGGINRFQSNLKPGSSQYINGIGAVTTTAGTNIARIGLALSAREMQVLPPKYRLRGVITYNCGNTASQFVNVGFYAGSITFAAGTTGVGTTGIGTSYGNDSNSNIGSVASPSDTLSSFAWSNSSAHDCRGTVAKTQTGFTITRQAGALGTSNIVYEAMSD